MNIELEHPIHGRKTAYLEAEAVLDEKNGWIRAVGAPAKAEEPADMREVLVIAYEQKFGKKPHHKLGIEKIKAALA